MKKLVVSLFLVFGTAFASAEVKELKGTIAASKVEMDGKSVSTYVLKTSDGDVSINPKIAKKLKKYNGKTVTVKADVNEENTIDKITSIKADKKKKEKTQKKEKK